MYESACSLRSSLCLDERYKLALCIPGHPSLSSASIIVPFSLHALFSCCPTFSQASASDVAVASSLDRGTRVAELVFQRRFITGSCMHCYRWPGIHVLKTTCSSWALGYRLSVLVG